MDKTLTLLCYHWASGACLSSISPSFDEDLAALIAQYGPPSRIGLSIYNLHPLRGVS